MANASRRVAFKPVRDSLILLLQRFAKAYAEEKEDISPGVKRQVESKLRSVLKTLVYGLGDEPLQFEDLRAGWKEALLSVTEALKPRPGPSAPEGRVGTLVAELLSGHAMIWGREGRFFELKLKRNLEGIAAKQLGSSHRMRAANILKVAIGIELLGLIGSSPRKFVFLCSRCSEIAIKRPGSRSCSPACRKALSTADRKKGKRRAGA